LFDQVLDLFYVAGGCAIGYAHLQQEGKVLDGAQRLPKVMSQLIYHCLC